jgi:GrpB-like predicted nucleotidyltransferase (UPF0157 family)
MSRGLLHAVDDGWEPYWRDDVHVHVYSAGCAEIMRCLMFRERLWTNTEDRCRYEETKRALAKKDWPDMNAYANAKSEVNEAIIAAAQADGLRSGQQT